MAAHSPPPTATIRDTRKSKRDGMRQRNARQPSHSIMLDAQNNNQFSLASPAHTHKRKHKHRQKLRHTHTHTDDIPTPNVHTRRHKHKTQTPFLPYLHFVDAVLLLLHGPLYSVYVRPAIVWHSDFHVCSHRSNVFWRRHDKYKYCVHGISISRHHRSVGGLATPTAGSFCWKIRPKFRRNRSSQSWGNTYSEQMQ